MNISQLAKAVNVTPDTLRYYEKQGLLKTPARLENGYRSYTEADVALLRFVRGAQALGFSLNEIREILPQFVQGKFGRAEIEQQLQTKMAQIDAHIAQLQMLKAELTATFSALTCSPNRAVSVDEGTAQDSGSGAGRGVARKTFSKPKRKKLT